MLFAHAAYNVVITIYKPDGSYWTYAVGRFSGNLPSTGTYSVVISSGTWGGSGAYSLSYVRGGSSVSDGSLTSGQTFNGSLSENGLDSFQITGSAGQDVVIFGSSASYGVYIQVYKPDGSYWTYGSNRFYATLPDSGTYTVIVYANSDTATGPYNLRYVRGSDSVSDGSLTSGQTFNGSLPANGLDSFQITGTAGQGVLFFGSSASYGVYIEVYKPDGSYWRYALDRFYGTLPDSGTYTVTVYANSDTATGAYNLYYVRGADSVSDGMLVSTLPRSGTLQTNALESYKFSGVASNSLSVSTTASYSRYIELYKPDGSYWMYGASSISATLPATGEYTLVMYGSALAATGEYSITLTTPPAPVAASTPSKIGADTMSCPTGDPKMVANPIEFDVGFKKQVENDYDAGGLTFSRIYRSDSTWTNNTIGALWRHNYARTLTVTGSTAEITDGTGATTHYTLSGSDWIPDDPDTTATFKTVGSDYVYTLPDNTVERYNSSKRLTRIEYIGGGALNLAYNGSGQLTSVTNENGRQLTLTYSSGRVATLVTPDGTFSYSYDGNGNLDEVTKPDTKTRQYHYEDGTYINALTGMTDEAGVRFATFDYDAGGKAIMSEHAGSVDNYDVSYNVDGTTTTTNPLGKDTTYYFTNILGVRRVIQVDGEASANCVASNRYYNYDEKGRVIGKTDWENNTTRYDYDDRSNITKIIEASGTADQRVKTITYNNDFNLPELITESDKTTAYDYDTYGRMTSMTVTDTNTSETRVTSYTYYSNTTDGSGNVILGRLETVNGPRTDVGDTTTYAYDANFNLTTLTNALSQVTSITSRDSALP
ncbi:MAG: hypothetical protein AUJ12_09035 [Alphaproteobacteria bacterium CG1_02_46_17]|nr:MAG: hypothetical protein AUJ12_09035 [Alphaproteobacteria bacterium CG1_02_46_17]